METVNEFWFLTLFYVIISIITVTPFYFRIVPRNFFWGFRTPKSRESNDNWYAINRYYAIVHFIWMIVLIIEAGLVHLLFEFFGLSFEMENLVIFTIVPVIFVPGIMVLLKYDYK